MFPVLMTLQIRQVRDEAHRFAVAYHRKLRGKDMFLPERDAAGSAEEVDRAVGSDVEPQGFESIPGALPLRARHCSLWEIFLRGLSPRPMQCYAAWRRCLSARTQ